jgi:pimeloyl-ACP methyl ester carboxylesterase
VSILRSLLWTLLALVNLAAVSTATAQDPQPQQRSRGLHGYIGYSASQPENRAEYGAGMGFYSAAWTLVDQPLAHFQIGLASGWISPDNSDNPDQPLAPIGTRARDNWPERGPTWGSVFQTVEGGLGYWAGNRFRYGPPKFSMNATPQCYDYEVGSPGWSFFYDTEALPDARLGIAQLSNRLLIPPDALPFEGTPEGKFLGYSYMALPFTEPVPSLDGKAPIGDQAWTCFLSTENFKGPIAYYIPETWSKIGDLFDYEFIYGRGLDARAGSMGGGAMEINTVPQLTAKDAQGNTWSKIPELKFPVDAQGDAVLVQDVTYYSKKALYDDFKAWREGGPAPSGSFDPAGSFVAKLSTRTPGFDQDGLPIEGVANTFDTKVFSDSTWGLTWKPGGAAEQGSFPQYYRHEGEKRIAVAAKDVPKETGLHEAEFRLAEPGQPFTSPDRGAWAEPGPQRGPYQVVLGDGSLVSYSWYRFVDQPSFQQYNWTQEKRDKLQALVEKIHRAWPIDRDYMPPPSTGELLKLDPALFVTPPLGMEVGYVPIVTRQEAASARFDLERSLRSQSTRIESGEFHGFREARFAWGGAACRVVFPKLAAAGQPWVWRARFWGHEPQFDRAMLELGWHVVYCEVGGLFGNPEAMQRWDALYQLLTQSGLHPKPFLEGMSRGGLAIYQWAKQHPDRVLAIYADNPVCDPRSWPGGAGASTRREAEWTQCLAAYGFAEVEASAFADFATRDLEKLVEARIPILHIVGEADSVVPVTENSELVEARVRELGGQIQVIRKPGLDHHPHSLPDPQKIVAFALAAWRSG